jgi:hypothetical protein
MFYIGWHSMLLKKGLILGTALSYGLTALGVGLDIGAADGTGDNTVPHAVPATVLAAATTSVFVSAVYVANMVTGEETRVPPVDRREYVPYLAPPAGRYVYLVGLAKAVPS